MISGNCFCKSPHLIRTALGACKSRQNGVISFHTSTFLQGKAVGCNVTKQARMLEKIMTGRKQGVKVGQYSKAIPAWKTYKEMGMDVKGMTSGGPRIRSKKCLRRVEVLNALFMEHISCLMSTGDASQELLGLGLTITRVKVSNDFSKIMVYWVATLSEEDAIITPILQKASGILRHELSTLRVIGIVPPIVFIKDMTHCKVIEVEQLLSRVDMGEHFTPTCGRFLYNQDETIKTTNETEDSDNDVSISCSAKYLAPSSESDLYRDIKMRQDMLGVKYDVVMGNIRQKIANSSARKKGEGVQLFRKEPELQRESIDDDSTISNPHENYRDNLNAIRLEVKHRDQRQKDFYKYLKKLQYTKEKQSRQTSCETKEKEFYEQEALDRWNRSQSHSWENQADGTGADEDYDDFNYSHLHNSYISDEEGKRS